MIFNSDTVYYIIWAAVIGIAFAIVYTNLQRGAISRFISSLISNDISCQEKALTLQDMNISGISAKIIKSAVKNQNGLKKAVCCFAVSEKEPCDEAERLISGNKETYRYCLSDTVDTDELLKKYSFKKLGVGQILLVLACVIITAILATKAVDILETFARKTSEEQQEEQQNDDAQQKNENEAQSDSSSNTASDNNNLENKTPSVPPAVSEDSTKDDGEVSRPSIPMLPTAQ